MKVKWIPLLLLVLVLIPVGCTPDRSLQDKNILVIVIDTLRLDRLGIHGCAQGLTPGLDALAREGFFFHHAIAPSSYTQPSVASLFTGLYPSRHGALGVRIKNNSFSFLRQDHLTLAEQFREAGYRTGAFITNANLSASLQFDQGFDQYLQPAGIAEELLDKASAWIGAMPRESKFFCYLHLIDPHMPYFPPEKYRVDHALPQGPGPRSPFTQVGNPLEIQRWEQQYNRWQARHPDKPFAVDYEKLTKDGRRFLKVGEEFNPEAIRSRINIDFNGFNDPALLQKKDFLVSLYDGEVAYTDLALDRFINQLKTSGELDETILVVTGDHGEAFLEHGKWGHGFDNFNELIRIPLIFRIPGPDGPIQGSHDAQVSLVDLFPTLLDILDLVPPANLDGLSLWPIIRNPEQETLRRRPVFCETVGGKYDVVSVQVGDSGKLIRTLQPTGNTTWEYFDLQADPQEQNPLAIDRKNPRDNALRKAIQQLLKQRTPGEEASAQGKGLSGEELEMMQELGYL